MECQKPSSTSAHLKGRRLAVVLGYETTLNETNFGVARLLLALAASGPILNSKSGIKRSRLTYGASLWASLETSVELTSTTTDQTT